MKKEIHIVLCMKLSPFKLNKLNQFNRNVIQGAPNCKNKEQKIVSGLVILPTFTTVECVLQKFKTKTKKYFSLFMFLRAPVSLK